MPFSGVWEIDGSESCHSIKTITIMCDQNKEKRSYHVDLTQVVDGKIQEVFNFNFGGHHDLAALAQLAAGL